MSKNNRMIHGNVRNVLATSVLATAFAFTLVAGQASADTEKETDTSLEELVQEEQAEEGLTVEEESSENEMILVDEEPISFEIDEEAPSLIPGNFLYFTKQLLESVKLALTFDTLKEAELLLSFAQERIKEAAALYAQGEYELANEVLQQAIDQQELAFGKYEEEEEEETIIVEEDAVVIETEEEEEEAAEEVAGPVQDDGQEQADVQDQEQVDSIREELEAKFSSNILALQAALERVKNPQAQAALQKNIEKAQAKLERKVNKRLAKLQEKGILDEETLAEVEAELEAELVIEEPMEEEIQEETPVEETEETKEETVVAQGKQATKAEVKQQNGAAKQAEQKQQKEAGKKAEQKQRAEVKQQKEAGKKAEQKQHTEAKQQKEAGKKAEHQQRAEEKQQRGAAKKAEQQQRQEAKGQKQADKKGNENKKGKSE